MEVTVSMESLWAFLDSLSLSRTNREWLADKLLEEDNAGHCDDEEEYISKEEILAGIAAGLEDLKAGRSRPAEALLKELVDEV